MFSRTTLWLDTVTWDVIHKRWGSDNIAYVYFNGFGLGNNATIAVKMEDYFHALDNMRVTDFSHQIEFPSGGDINYMNSHTLTICSTDREVLDFLAAIAVATDTTYEIPEVKA